MTKRELPAKPTHYFRLFCVLSLLLILRLSSPTSAVAYLLLAGYALRGPSYVIHALVGSWLLTLTNSGIFPDVPAASFLRYVVLFASAGSVLFRATHDRKNTKNTILLATGLLSALILIQVIFVSDILLPFVLKLVAWSTGVVTLLAAWGRLSSDEKTKVMNEIYVVLSALVFISLPLLFSGLGFFRNGRGFQGFMNHPQAFGITAGLLATWALARAVRLERPLKWHVFVAVMSLACVILSQARTAFFAMAIAISLSTVLFVWLDRKKMGAGGRVDKNNGGVLALALFGLGIGAILTDGGGLFNTFVAKSQNAGGSSIGEAYSTSRGFLVDRMIMNIYTHPWTGIGFGSPSNLSDFIIELDPVFGLPIGAPIEKGVGPVAVLEELGIVLTAVFVLWLAMSLRAAWKSGYVPLTLAIFVLCTNLGEYTFFSLGGMGLLLMIVFTGSIREATK